METEKKEIIREMPQSDGSFCMKADRTTYQIGVFFNKTGKEDLNDKIKRLMKKEVMAESTNLKKFE
ncbi:MAG: hypothetical protein GXX89_11215 [Clostridiales bacterium]|jgi:hypothetical protein|nr:hypothetical protein [Clostridiales bacterium]